MSANISQHEASCWKWLDKCCHGLANEPSCAEALLSELIKELARLRIDCTRHEWRAFGEYFRSNHPGSQILYQDPFTQRALRKPRGYAGDAKIMDFIYGYNQANHITEAGRKILKFTTSTPTAESVKHRCEMFAHAIDNIALKHESTSILALGCGHLREAHFTKAVKQKRFDNYLAFDQDPKSLKVVNELFSNFGVTPVEGSVLDLSFSYLGKFDLIYAAGLYDYLWQGAAKDLTAYSFNMLNTGGTLIIANVLPSIPDVGYMEAVMDWWLVYRTIEKLVAVADLIPPKQIARKRTFTDPLGNIVFLEIIHK